MPLWAEDPSADCANPLETCNVYIGNLAVIHQELEGALTFPFEYILKTLKKILRVPHRRLEWGLDLLRSQIQDTANQLVGVALPFIPPPVPQEPGNPLAPPLGFAPVQNVVAIASKGNRVPCEDDVTSTAQDRRQAPHDLDQPHVLRFADASERWHQQLIAFYGWPMARLLTPGDLVSLETSSAIANREQAERTVPPFPERTLSLGTLHR
jgi:hypothetical protein